MKIVSAIALLEEPHERFDPDSPYKCRGFLTSPGSRRCAIFKRTGEGHGEMTLDDALAESCNTYFFHHATTLPPESLLSLAARLGLGQRSAVELPDEKRGKLPVPHDVEELRNLLVGQGKLLVTPLQIARMTACVARDGLLIKPTVRLSDSSQTGENLHLDAASLADVRLGMARAVSDGEGTAHAALGDAKIAIAAKTGTAESGVGRADHAWIAAYAPANDPRYVIVVALEHAGEGAEAAGPVVRSLAERTFEKYP